jgi:hypothetical protein
LLSSLAASGFVGGVLLLWFCTKNRILLLQSRERN